MTSSSVLFLDCYVLDDRQQRARHARLCLSASDMRHVITVVARHGTGLRRSAFGGPLVDVPHRGTGLRRSAFGGPLVDVPHRGEVRCHSTHERRAGGQRRM